LRKFVDQIMRKKVLTPNQINDHCAPMQVHFLMHHCVFLIKCRIFLKLSRGLYYKNLQIINL